MIKKKIFKNTLLVLVGLLAFSLPVISYPVGNTIYNPVVKGNMTLNSNTVSGNATWTGTHVFSGATSFGSTVKLKDGTTATKYLNLASNGNGGTPMTADRTLTFDVYNAARNIDLAGDLTVSGNSSINQNLQTNASPTFESVKFNDDTTTAYNLLIDSDSTVPLSADRTLTIDMDDGDRNLQLSGNLVVGLAGGAINQDVSTTANPSFATVKSTATLGTAGANVTAAHYGDGMDITTVLTLASAVIGAPTAGANEAVGALIFTFPAGVHVQSVSYFNIGLTIGTVTTDTPDVGLGSVIASGNVATLNGTATFEDYLTGQTWGVALDGSSQSAGPLGATAGVLSGISLNKATDAKTLHLNVADGWDAGITGNLTASGTVTIKWTKM